MTESSSITQIACTFRDVRFSPAQQPCPECGAVVPRVWEVARVAVDAQLDGIGLLRVHVGVYRCWACARYFRACPPFLGRGATYTRRVVVAAVQAVWPAAVHQLCLFHQTRHVVASVLRVLPAVRLALPKPPRTATRGGRLHLRSKRCKAPMVSLRGARRTRS